MSGKPGGSYNDVGSLIDQLGLGAIGYREFGKPKPAAMPVADRPQPVTARAESSAAIRSFPAGRDEEETTARVRPAASGSPLAFTFERLRRQAIGSSVRAPTLTLALPERSAVSAEALGWGRRQRTWAEIFAELEAASRSRAVA